MTVSYFDDAAPAWDSEPRRVALAKAVGAAILREARPTKEMDVLDYGCGTGLVSLFLLPHVRSVTGADSSAGMLEVLREKIAEGGLQGMQVMRLDAEHESVPQQRFNMVVASMILHHAANVERVLRAFHEMLLPGGTLCIADLDTEPGLFHTPEAVASVHHLGFDRGRLKGQLDAIGLSQIASRYERAVR
jgi:ubiquinone/menaquinone biosynthesis C-methylase UbiE